jgi:hypothetical protein
MEHVLELINVSVALDTQEKNVIRLDVLEYYQQISMFAVEEEIVQTAFVLALLVTLEMSVKFVVVLEFFLPMQMFVHLMENVLQQTLVNVMMDTTEPNVKVKFALANYQPIQVSVLEMENALDLILVNVTQATKEQGVTQLNVLQLLLQVLLLVQVMESV